MLVATITEAKNSLSALIDRVRNGETVLIVDRGIPVARLESAVGREDGDDGRLARLERAGVLRRARQDPDLLTDPPPALAGDADVVRYVIDERAAGP